MKGIARGVVWWLEMDTEIESNVNSCKECQLSQKTPAQALLILVNGCPNHGQGYTLIIQHPSDVFSGCCCSLQMVGGGDGAHDIVQACD